MARMRLSTRAKRSFSRSTGIPTTRSGRSRKLSRATGGCLSMIFSMLLIVALLAVLIGSAAAESVYESSNVTQGVIHQWAQQVTQCADADIVATDVSGMTASATVIIFDKFMMVGYNSDLGPFFTYHYPEDSPALTDWSVRFGYVGQCLDLINKRTPELVTDVIAQAYRADADYNILDTLFLVGINSEDNTQTYYFTYHYATETWSMLVNDI